MADRAIHVAVLEGYFASLTTLGLPMPLSLQLQQSNLRLEKAMWTARSTRTGFSVSLFWPFADSSQTELKQKMKKRRRNRRKAKATTNLNNNNLAPSTPGSCVSIPINANFRPAASWVTSATAANSLSLQSERGTDHSVSQEHDDDHSVSQECGDDTSPNSTLSQESQNVEPTIDLNECSEIHYHQDGDMHGVKYVCEGREGWTPVVGKGGSTESPHACSDSEHLLMSEQLYLLVALTVILTQALTALCTFHQMLMFNTLSVVVNLV